MRSYVASTRSSRRLTCALGDPAAAPTGVPRPPRGVSPASAYAARSLLQPTRHLEPNLGSDPTVEQILEQKRAWTAQRPGSGKERRVRFETLTRAQCTAPASRGESDWELGQQASRCRQQVQANGVLQRRDYAFCLYRSVACVSSARASCNRRNVQEDRGLRDASASQLATSVQSTGLERWISNPPPGPDAGPRAGCSRSGRQAEFPARAARSRRAT